MISQDFIPKIKELDKIEKIKLLQYLVTEIAKEEGISNINAENEKLFWLKISEHSLAEIWDDSEENIYNELL